VIVVAVPVKDLGAAKQRLVPALPPERRAGLAAAMLRDVLGALAAARVDAVWVVTRDPGARAAARAAGAEVLEEPANQGHTAAVARAQAEAAHRGARVFATVPGDVPCVTAAEVRALVEAAADDPGAVFVASRSGLGTNGVALAPPAAMPLRFGEPSFPDHLREARARGLRLRILALPGLALDVDDPADLARLAGEGAATESGRLVRQWTLTGAGGGTRPPARAGR
jgi:2-phospho-L-lactate guanylyltransferase